MSVLIKGVDMPKSCVECIFDVWGGCLINLNIEPKNKLTHSCPLIELPDHGDLIERDTLKEKAEFIGDAFTGRGGYVVWGDDILNAPTVIPEERSEDGET